MDLNYLLSRHQVALIRADEATCPEARIAHRGMAHDYAKRIGIIRRLISEDGIALVTA
jgi:hypothetical protein